ncbi:helix-turn-helix transcriptional regulator [Bacteroidota bacterium]
MFEFQTKIKRQIELLGICIANERKNKLSILDLAEIFDVEELTIKRDLQDLRANGIDIHSAKKFGVCITGKIPLGKLKEIARLYIGLCFSQNSFDKSTALMVSKLKEKAICNIVVLQRCIDNNKAVNITYEKIADEPRKTREVFPIQLFQTENNWRVLALDNGIIKQFLLNKIVEVKETGKKFKRIPQNQIDDLFKHSWKSWQGNEKFNVKLKFSKEWAARIIPQQLMESQIIEEYKDGTMDLSITVNSLSEIASWIVSRGEGVIVIEPPELKERVLELAKGTVGNYE